MQAIQLVEFGVESPDAARFQRVTLPDPSPGPGEVLVRMEAASLNYRDLMIARNRLYADVALPLVPVADGAGTVVEVGAGVTRFRPGDRVTTVYKPAWIGGRMRPEWQRRELGGPDDGVMRELACFPPYALAHVPAHLSLVQAATLPCAALTAWHVLERAGATSGQTVLTLGTGGVSTFAVQLARLRGARVIVTSSSDDKLARARALGADVGINYATTPDWSAAVLEATGGRGADVVVENAGAATLEQSLKALHMEGFVGLVGFLSGGEAHVPLLQAMLKRARLEGVSVASLESHERLLDAVAYAGLEPAIDSVYGFDALPEAYARLASGRHFGKIAIDFKA
jgi:NADPH:quinone reductase-like Zn-dependent oxidoreductase